MNPKQENVKLSKKIFNGLKLAYRRLYEQKAANNESVVISDGKGGVIRVPAKDLLKDLDKD
ncbi:MAG: hypothetical protein ACHQD8_07565 [Chitinophagales bacterium]